MNTTLRALANAGIAASLLVTGCTESTRPHPVPLDRSGGEASALLGGVTSTVNNLLVSPVKRSTPLANDVVWSFTAGPDGGTTHNAAVGLTVVVPQGALASTQTITVTAFKGSAIAYGFTHATFAKKVWLTQNLQGTSASGTLLNVLKGAHFPGATPQFTSSGLAIVDEIVSAVVLPLTNSVTFGVTHFSGWILASGNGSDERE